MTSTTYKIGDLKNSTELFNRWLKVVGVPKAEYQNFNGHPAQCVLLLKCMLLTMHPDVINEMSVRGCNLSSRDKKIVIAAFDILRDYNRLSPSITIEQFMTKVR